MLALMQHECNHTTPWYFKGYTPVAVLSWLNDQIIDVEPGCTFQLHIQWLIDKYQKAQLATVHLTEADPNILEYDATEVIHNLIRCHESCTHPKMKDSKLIVNLKEMLRRDKNFNNLANSEVATFAKWLILDSTPFLVSQIQECRNKYEFERMKNTVCVFKETTFTNSVFDAIHAAESALL
jgi:hypothetical protein